MVKTSIVRVADNVLAEAETLRQTALDGKFHHPKDVVGWRMPPVRVPGAGARIERLFGVKITRWHGSKESCTLFLAFDRGRRRERIQIHSDTPPNAITLVLYLNHAAPAGTGTSLWRHRKTGLTSLPSLQEARAAGFKGGREALDDWIADALWAVNGDRRKWQEVVRVENVFNRGVMYRGGLFHSATGHFGENPNNGRIYGLFQFDIAD